nr:MAG TPA: Erv1 / Alr family protein [Caudoviricetes sp.]
MSKIRNGIIKDGMLHVLSPGNKIPCQECSLRYRKRID